MENFECGKFLGDEPILEVFFPGQNLRGYNPTVTTSFHTQREVY